MEANAWPLGAAIPRGETGPGHPAPLNSSTRSALRVNDITLKSDAQRLPHPRVQSTTPPKQQADPRDVKMLHSGRC